jgi:hypothetical protein
LAGWHPRTQKHFAQIYAKETAERRELERAERERMERFERSLERQIQEDDERRARTAPADPPPELSPEEKRERELLDRVDRLEGKEQAERLIGQGLALRKPESSEEDRRKDALRLLRIRKARRAGRAQQGASEALRQADQAARNPHRRHRGEAQRRGRQASGGNGRVRARAPGVEREVWGRSRGTLMSGASYARAEREWQETLQKRKARSTTRKTSPVERRPVENPAEARAAALESIRYTHGEAAYREALRKAGPPKGAHVGEGQASEAGRASDSRPKPIASYVDVARARKARLGGGWSRASNFVVSPFGPDWEINNAPDVARAVPQVKSAMRWGQKKM